MRNCLKTQLSLLTTYSRFVATLEKLSSSASSGISSSSSADQIDIGVIGLVPVSISILLDIDSD